MDIFLSQLWRILAIPAATLIIGGITYSFRWLGSKLKNDTVRSYVELTGRITTDVVMEAMQTAVEEAKEKSSDGKLTKAEGIEIKNQVIRQVKELLPDHALSIFMKANIDADRLIASMVERNVLESKYAKRIRAF